MLTDNQRLIMEHAADKTNGVISWYPSSLRSVDRSKLLRDLLKLGYASTDGTQNLTAAGYDAIGRPQPPHFYTSLIAKEEAKLELLRKKVAVTEQVIQALRGIDTDDIDTALTKQIGNVVPVSHVRRQSDAPAAVSVSRMPARKESVVPVVLEFLGKDGKTMDQLAEYMKMNKHTVTRAGLRTLLMNLRKNKGLVDNPMHGFYKLSDAGEKALSA